MCIRDRDADLDIHILKMYLHTKSELSRQRVANVKAQTGHTDECISLATLAAGKFNQTIKTYLTVLMTLTKHTGTVSDNGHHD